MKETSNFRYIWSEWIVPLIDELYSQTDEQFRTYCNLRVRNLDELCNHAEKYYQYKREELKRIFYGEYHKGDSETEHRMDFHKMNTYRV